MMMIPPIALVSILFFALPPQGLAQLNQTVPSDGELMSLCTDAFRALQFKFQDLDRFHAFFRDDSELTLSQAGVYRGVEGIREYVVFALEESPYVAKRVPMVRKLFFKNADFDKGICTFIAYGVNRIETDHSNVREAVFLNSVMSRISYDFRQNYIPDIKLFFTQSFMSFFFEQVLATDQTMDYICSVLDQDCPGTNVEVSKGLCKSQLRSLPLLTEGTATAKDLGCRALHSIFAAHNDYHCPHISFEPQEDPSGNIKCQESSNPNISPLDLFEQSDIDEFLAFLDSRESFIESNDGYKILYFPKETDRVRLVIFGAIVPLVLFGLTYLTFRAKHRHNAGPSTATEELLAKRNRQLQMVILIIPLTLVFFNGMGGLVLWFIKQNHPEWEEHDSGYRRNVDLLPTWNAYWGNPLKVGETDPQEQMSDDQFQVYVGVAVWVTCVIAGIGLELFVWHQYLQVWCEKRETLWRFVEFIFPLMLVTALGLSTHQNYLALPILVLGLYKFGFPETVMYLYLGMFATGTRLGRLSDLMNGVGTVVHHGAAGMIVCMIVVGVIPPSRYVFNNTLILAMQHWVATLSHFSRGIYCSTEIVLEYYFEWIILSNFADIYSLHWTAALGAGVMVFAHWLYLTAAIVEAVHEKSGEKEGESAVVHVRGNKEISKFKAQHLGQDIHSLDEERPHRGLYRGSLSRRSINAANQAVQFLKQEASAAALSDDLSP